MEKEKLTQTSYLSRLGYIALGALLAVVLAIGGYTAFAQTGHDMMSDSMPFGRGMMSEQGAMMSQHGQMMSQHGQMMSQHGQMMSEQGQMMRGGPGMMGDMADNSYLAEALGITTDELQAAHDSAHEAMLAQAVADGLLTQEQADNFVVGDHGRGQRLMGSMAMGTGHTFLADALGISVEALETARQTAQANHLAALVADGTITQEQADLMAARHAFQSYMKANAQAEYETALAEAVAAGAITQAQADLLLANGQGQGMMNGHGRGGNHPGRGNGQGQGRGNNGLGPNNGNAPASDS